MAILLMKMNCRSEVLQMNEQTNYRQFWRNLVICCVLCVLLFWIQMGYLSFRTASVVWEALWSLITTK
ncbi:Uncharacterised protein [Klebsiella pneumoniae]|uniref:Uncharacterized protein n=1 Tax=Klebsiella pneumoniae TaxID=573 RepID=A0A486PQA1_KLEPN|nr:hypothetical protein HMPREF1308_05340 [Klebsiella pneumoniae subsp. pneumoniae WGLW5]PCR29066.1 hypothetical protein CQA86_14330 [Klebsiella pneumoniae]SVV50457.1 Uncharacterised protein [Klebsiella pneumoniae]SWC63463.1 Uncharacterised protein [Klebsiella pneumoniae]SWC74234.1 Uncharacterised protein [Klebsiella pneumoniae]